METINQILGNAVSVLLMASGIFFFIRLRFWRLLIPHLKATKAHSKDSVASSFRALTVALAGTLGVGNIVGVASAIYSGGFGAVFWMWVSALCAMALKYAETVLAVSHRRRDKHGFFGGALYYIRDLFARLKLDRIGRSVAFIFACLLLLDSITTGCAVQINAAARSADEILNISPLILGIFTAVLTVSVVISGSQIVSRFTSYLIPILCFFYILMSSVLLFIERERVPYAFSLIFENAFRADSAAYGILGFLISRAMRFGTVRGLLSNEAGCGTSPTAHAAADTSSPSSQGLWGVFEVFFDTIVLCTLTALVMIVNYDSASSYGNDGIMSAISAYSATLGPLSSKFLALSVIFFAVATVLCRAHYGKECFRYLFPKNHRTLGNLYLILYGIFTVFGALSSPDSIWGLSDFSISALTLINVIILILSRKEIFDETRKYILLKKARTKGKTP